MGCNSGLISQLYVSDETYKWCYKISADGHYYVIDLRDFIDSVITILVSNSTVWSPLVRLKVIGYVWCACFFRLPTVKALSRHGCSHVSMSCSLCPNGLDEIDNVLVNCSLAMEALG